MIQIYKIDQKPVRPKTVLRRLSDAAPTAKRSLLNYYQGDKCVFEDLRHIQILHFTQFFYSWKIITILTYCIGILTPIKKVPLDSNSTLNWLFKKGNK